MTTISVTGTKELQMALEALGDDISQAVTDAVNATGLEIRGDVIKRLSQKGTGTMYFRIYDEESGFTNIFAGDSEGYVASIKGKLNLSPTHRASADGHAPAVDTGRLKNSVTFTQTGPMSVSVGSKVKYAAWLEFGTIKMAPRPAWGPASLAAQPKFRKRLEAAIAGAIR